MDNVDMIAMCEKHRASVVGVISIVLQVLLSVTVILVNSFILAALWNRRRVHIARSHLFVLNLVVCGLLGGCNATLAMVLDSTCVLSTLFAQRQILCSIRLITFLFIWMGNVNALAVIAIDRYILIVHSLRYVELMTKRRVLALISGAWFVSGLGAFSVLLDNTWKPGHMCMEQNVVPPWHLLAVQIPMNALVLLVLTAAHLRIRAEAARSRKQHLHRVPELPTKVRGGERSNYSARSARSATVITQVVLCYLTAFTPIQVVLILVWSGIGSNRSWINATDLYLPLLTLGFLINPFLYTWQNTNLRADLVIAWRRIQNPQCISRSPPAHTVCI